MAINILVIDDDRKMAERLMRGLQRADKENVLGEIQVDDSVIKLETVENYDISHFETTFDVALIDYQSSTISRCALKISALSSSLPVKAACISRSFACAACTAFS